MFKHSYDIIIVGAGPAGAMLAYELSRKGIDVLIIERKKLPRYKCCAGGITHKVIDLLDFDITAALENTIFDIDISYKYDESYLKHYSKPLIYTVMRDEFDYLLVKKAQRYGARLLDGCKVTGVIMNTDYVEVETPTKIYYSRLIAGADGVYSIVANKLGIKPKIEYLVGLEAELGVSEEELVKWKSRVRIELGSIPGGYAWVFPKRNHLSIGAGCQFSRAKKLEHFYHSFVSSLELGKYSIIKSGSSLIPALIDHTICCGERFVLLGDAAGLADPLTGEGIYNAILSAKLAAPAVESSLAVGESKLHYYQQSVQNIIMPELKIASKLAKLLIQFPHLMFKSLTGNEGIWKNSCCLMRGETSYSTTIEKMDEGIGNIMRLKPMADFLFKLNGNRKSV